MLRAVPGLVLILGLSVLAGTVWLRVLDRAGHGVAGAAVCGTASTAPLDPRTVKVRVYNATDRSGLARTVSGLLRQRGFAVLETANDPLADVRQVTGSAEVRYGPAGARQADLVRRQVPGAKLYRDVREDAVIDLALGPAYQRLSTAAELAKARQGIVARPGRATTSTPATPTC